MTSPSEPSSDEAVIVRAAMRLARRLRQAAGEAELSGAGLGLVATLRREGPMSAVELARREGLQPQSLSRLLASLDRDGFIIRAADEADRRRHAIAVTPHGAQALRRSMALRRRWLADAMAGRLDKDERRTLLDAAELMLRIAT